MNWNVANQVDRDRSTTITIASQRSTNSEGGRGGFSSHGTHVFGTVRNGGVCRHNMISSSSRGHCTHTISALAFMPGHFVQ
jgi:hypothetical protein